jgi:hypothetical protein
MDSTRRGKKNVRRFIGTSRNRPDKRAERKGQAEARQEAYDALSIEEKLRRLPPAPEANKQRTKLLAQLEAPKKNQESKKEGVIE